VRDVVESYSPEAAFNRSPLTLNAPPTLQGRCDRLALEQIVSNLISNAIKFGAGASIDVSLESKQDNSVQFQVHDRGIGIAKDDQERIFGRFERLSAQPGHPAGAGVGLWLVRGLVESHGGTLEVSSEPAKGATFTVVLPQDVGSTAGERHDQG
jgi:two-component system, OmpR family, sensor kinase